MVLIYRPQFGSYSHSAHLGTISVKEGLDGLGWAADRHAGHRQQRQ